ncbi:MULTISPECIES: ATP-binding cassette domain-containing protein [Vibrio]|uniref:ATP-binding cassette domain-containing protein n=1 Tax=Vibrio TaxID=662 RepID=UPI001EE0AD00|nr:ATP-binding cassette domain-containing protein [Vibrio cincinnatiensis]MCG3748310.1 ATP-binding cassette domain-containing protein [Vibrio cincinnatiensis]
MAHIKLKKLVLDYPVNNKDFVKKDNESQVGGNIITESGKTYLRALDNINIEINRGDRVALVGHNGAGKSTLLKVMAGIYQASSGDVEVSGKVAPLFNLKFGMDNELTGYENIELRGLYLGLSRKEIREKKPRIVECSGLGDFLHMPIKTYSSGMLARLAFAVSTSVDADILLLDEMIGTGDANFINKAKNMLEEFVSSSNILVLASHSNKVLRQICNKAILFEHGKIVSMGDMENILELYRHKIDVESKIKTKYDESITRNLRALLINDTGLTENIGCRAVRAAIEKLISNKIDIVESSYVGYGQEYYSNIASPSSDWIDRTNDYPKYKSISSALNYDEWESIRVEQKDNDSYLLKSDNYDLIIVNAEGSIHHNSKRALAILAQIKNYTEIGKKVIVLNATISDMSEDVLKSSLNNVDFIHVREKYSQSYLQSLGLKCTLSTDIAKISISESHKFVINTGLINPKMKNCLVSLGVLANEISIKNTLNIVQGSGYTPYYLSMGDGNEFKVAAKVCAELGVDIIESKNLILDDVPSYLKQFDMVVSGRHHLNLFVLESGVTLIPLPSNTLKIEGTLELLEPTIGVAYNYESLKSMLDNGANNKKKNLLLKNDYIKEFETAFYDYINAIRPNFSL